MAVGQKNRDRRPIRPDAIDLVGPDFDSLSSEPADRTLIICSAPRTGSTELCRFLFAAGIGVPHEYFHQDYSRKIAERWGFWHHPLEESHVGRYIALLRRRRAQNGVFATKLQYVQFERTLKNHHGAALFNGACVVHLFRPDAANQYASLRAARESGRWDFSQRHIAPPVVRDNTNFNKFLKEAVDELNWIVGEEANFRCLFILLGIHPIFVTTDELFSEPRRIIDRIAKAMAVTINETALEHAIACGTPYGREREAELAMSRLIEPFKRVVFQAGEPFGLEKNYGVVRKNKPGPT
jgi:LPS sulfotransferase NodH